LRFLIGRLDCAVALPLETEEVEDPGMAWELELAAPSGMEDWDAASSSIPAAGWTAGVRAPWTAVSDMFIGSIDGIVRQERRYR